MRWFDEESRAVQTIRAPLVFLCASALESTRILLLSRPSNSPAGLGGDSGALGRYLMDHTYVKLEGQSPALVAPAGDLDMGRCVFLPRFDARHRPGGRPEGRGFGVQVAQFSAGWGGTYFVGSSFGEMLPNEENHVTLDPERQDAWGIPVLRIDCRHTQEDLARAREQADALRELADVAGVRSPQLSPVPAEPGASVHECGTARMGTSPSDSVLDPHNQCWEARGLYVTDGASFPSQGYQNPTLTIMALTARACDHALKTRFGKIFTSKGDSWHPATPDPSPQ
ncbi:MAG: GMC oxidoreductase [Vicinamibacterales bacterium]